jgi:hypothetical protein
MSDRASVLECFEAAFREFDALVGGLTEGQMEEPFLGLWSARDLAAHFTGCHRDMTHAFERLARGLTPADPDRQVLTDDEANARFVSTSHGLSSSEVLAAMRQAFAGCLAAAVALTPGRFADGPQRWLTEEAAHYTGHTQELRDWLSRR